MMFDLLNLADVVTLDASIRFSDDELIEFSEEMRPCKVERNRFGEIVVRPATGGTGSLQVTEVGYWLYDWNKTIGAGRAFGWGEGFALPDGSCLSPDASWISQVRLDGLTCEQTEIFPMLCPDFVIEVRSRNDLRMDIKEKMQLWIENGAKLAWLVDPIDANVTIYRPDGSVERLERPEVVRGTGVVEGFELACSRLWPR